MEEFYLKLVSTIFYQIYIFSPNDSPLKIMENVFYYIKKALFILKIFKFLCFCLPLFFSLSAIALEIYPRKILVLWHLNKDFMTHFVWYHEKKIRCDIETLTIDRVLNKEHFYGKIMQKIMPKTAIAHEKFF